MGGIGRERREYNREIRSFNREQSKAGKAERRETISPREARKAVREGKNPFQHNSNPQKPEPQKPDEIKKPDEVKPKDPAVDKAWEGADKNKDSSRSYESLIADPKLYKAFEPKSKQETIQALNQAIDKKDHAALRGIMDSLLKDAGLSGASTPDERAGLIAFGVSNGHLGISKYNEKTDSLKTIFPNNDTQERTRSFNIQENGRFSLMKRGK